MDGSLVVNKTNYFFINWKIHDFWVLKIWNFWTTLRMWMKSFEANAVFQQLVKIGRGHHPFDFYLEASFDADKYQNFPKIDKKVNFFDKIKFHCGFTRALELDPIWGLPI